MNPELNLKSLKAFRAIMEDGSATAAANRLGMSQPGISRLLAVLEQTLGFQLFHREKSQLLPSDEALALYEEVVLILDGTDRIVQLSQNLRHSDIGRLKIVAPNSFIAGPLADAVTSFMQRHPGVQISLDTHSPAAAREMVARRVVDCGFIQLPETHPGLICEPMLSGETVCALSTEHPLSQRNSLDVTDLRHQPLILLGQGRYSRQQIDELFARAGVEMKVKLETHTVAVACSFSKRNLGIALVKQELAAQYAGANLKLIPFTPTLIHTYGFIYSAHVPMSRLTQAFYQHCRRSFDGQKNTLVSDGM